MRVDIERILCLYEELRKINEVPIYDLQLYKNGERVYLPDDVLNEFDFIGLTNTSLIKMEFEESE